jgi:hypothetical protein
MSLELTNFPDKHRGDGRLCNSRSTVARPAGCARLLSALLPFAPRRSYSRPSEAQDLARAFRMIAADWRFGKAWLRARPKIVLAPLNHMLMNGFS